MNLSLTDSGNNLYMIVFLVLVLVLGAFFVIKKPGEKFKNNKLLRNYNNNNLNKLLSNSNKILNKEHFYASPPQEEEEKKDTETSNNALETLKNEIDNSLINTNKKVIEKNTDKIILENLQNNMNNENIVSQVDVIDNAPASTEQVDLLITQLDDLEDKCNILEQRELEKQQKEKERLAEIHRQQLDIETEKINSLKDIVKYYKKQYNNKLNINKKCRDDIESNLQKDVNHIKENESAYQDRGLKFNVDFEQIKNLVN